MVSAMPESHLEADGWMEQANDDAAAQTDREALIGERVRVLPRFDIPPMFRAGGLPSEGMVESVHGDGTLVVIVDGKAVPYQPEEIEVVS